MTIIRVNGVTLCHSKEAKNIIVRGDGITVAGRNYISSGGKVRVSGNMNIVGDSDVIESADNSGIDGTEIVVIDGIESIEIEGDIHTLKIPVASKVCVTGNVDTIHTQSGDVYCDNVSGDIYSQSGDINCNTVSGNVLSQSGDISIKE